MSQGDKRSYTPAQKRKARRIEQSYGERGVPEKEAAAASRKCLTSFKKHCRKHVEFHR